MASTSQAAKKTAEGSDWHIGKATCDCSHGSGSQLSPSPDSRSFHAEETRGQDGDLVLVLKTRTGTLSCLDPTELEASLG